MKHWQILALVAWLMASSPGWSQDIQHLRIVNWNAQALFEPSAAQTRTTDFQQFAQDLKPDILLLQEVTKLATVEKVRDLMGLEGYHIVMSDFEQNDGGAFNALEVAIISRLPVANVLEFDRSPDNQPGDPAEQKLERVDLPGIAETGVSRGFLYAEVPEVNLTLIVTHLKSSNGLVGEPDRQNAQKRELVAAAIAEHVDEILTRAGNGQTVLVAGDFNVGETDAAKNGRVLDEDRVDSQAGDRYDDTHAILSAGLIGGLRMASLTKSLGQETYVGAPFPGTGPIDVIYVAGPRVSQFTLAGAGSHAYGSDHLPVFTTFGVLGTAPITPPPIQPTAGIKISALFPNPEGPDEGHEWVKLKNTGHAEADLAGWLLVDRAGNELALSGTLAAGAERTIALAAGELPLNNAGGDDIRLVNPGGNVQDLLAYTSQQASPGQEIRRHE
jgi:endonuclease/exonuclease/phosphatase family metal-dependent hydrolase